MRAPELTTSHFVVASSASQFSQTSTIQVTNSLSRAQEKYKYRLSVTYHSLAHSFSSKQNHRLITIFSPNTMEQISSARIAPDSPLTTPTRNFTELSLNSPESDIVSSDQVSNIIQHLRLLETGREFFTCPWHAFPLSGEEFKHLIEILEADKELRGFFMKKVR